MSYAPCLGSSRERGTDSESIAASSHAPQAPPSTFIAIAFSASMAQDGLRKMTAITTGRPASPRCDFR